MCKNEEGIVMPNFAALRAAVFLLSTKTSGGADIRPPSVRGLILKWSLNIPVCHQIAKIWYIYYLSRIILNCSA